MMIVCSRLQVQERGARREGRGRRRGGGAARRPQGAAEARPHSLQGHEHGAKALRRSQVGVARLHGALQGGGGARAGARAAAPRAPRRAAGRAARAPRHAGQARLEPRRPVGAHTKYTSFHSLQESFFNINHNKYFMTENYVYEGTQMRPTAEEVN